MKIKNEFCDNNQIDQIYSAMMVLFSGNDQKTIDLIEPLVQNASFMQYTLKQLQKDILSSGTVDEYRNGEKQTGVKISASVQAYNAMMKNYNVVISKLSKYVNRDDDSIDKWETYVASNS